MGPSCRCHVAGLGCGRHLQARLPHSWPARTATFLACLRREGEEHLSRAGRGRLEEHSIFSYGLAEGLGPGELALQLGSRVAKHPSFLEA